VMAGSATSRYSVSRMVAGIHASAYRIYLQRREM
jgi:hypothetical protein